MGRKSSDVGNHRYLHINVSIQCRRPKRIKRFLNIKALSYHVKPLLCVLACGIAICAVNPSLLTVVDGCLANSFNCSHQVRMEITHNRPTNIVSQVPRTNQQHVYSWNFGDFLNLSVALELP
ncbi:glutaredoxin domain-containing protein [Histoplasma ohiense]